MNCDKDTRCNVTLLGQTERYGLNVRYPFIPLSATIRFSRVHKKLGKPCLRFFATFRCFFSHGVMATPCSGTARALHYALAHLARQNSALCCFEKSALALCLRFVRGPQLFNRRHSPRRGAGVRNLGLAAQGNPACNMMIFKCVRGLMELVIPSRGARGNPLVDWSK